MKQLETFLKELEAAEQVTRVFMERVRAEDFNWQPHEKSMQLIKLATHVAELPNWIGLALNTDELDFESSPYTPEQISTPDELVAYSARCYREAREVLLAANEAVLDKQWTLRSGETVYLLQTKAEMIRVALNQIVHHRAQLGVYFRLLDIPVPKSFGPTADDYSF